MSHNPFVICKAAAGSGKTFALVKEYLKLAMAGPAEGLESRFRGILAITFTNKAANEMKERLMRFLLTIGRHGADPERSAIGAALLADLNAMPYYQGRPLTSDQLRQMGATLHSAILHRYSDLSVLTIDSFMHRIVRTFAHDLGQPVNFEVMVDAEEMLDRVVEALMAEMGTADNEPLTRLMQLSADVRMEDSQSFRVEEGLRRVAAQLLSEEAIPHLRRLSGLKIDDFLDAYRRYAEANRALEEQLVALGAEAMALISGAGLGPEHLYKGKTGFYGYFARLAEGDLLDSAGNIRTPSATVCAAFGAESLGSAKCKGAAASALAGIEGGLRRCFGRLQGLVESELPRYNGRRQVMGCLFSVALLGEMGRLMRQCSRDDETLLLSEFNRMINDIVDREDAPFIFERLGNRYTHFLIDEFQDTSVMQWHNLVPLVENGVAQGRESLVVGDAKQAIYRFRQGDVRQFIDLPRVQGLRRHGQSLGAEGNWRQVVLGSNFRTARRVVEFNNDFFSWLARGHYAGNPLVQQIYVGQGTDGLPAAPGAEALRQRAERRVEGGVEAVFDNEVVARVAAMVRRLVDDEGYSYADIMILARKRARLNLVADALKASGVPITSAESFRLRASQAVCAMMAAMRWLYDAADTSAAADLLSRLAALGLAPANWQQQWAAQAAPSPLALLAEWGFDFRPAYLRSLDLYDLAEELLHVLRLQGVDTLYVASFLNYVASHAARHRQHLGELLEALDANPALSAISPEQADAVRLMTYHKAKGLEAPVVICALWYERFRTGQLWVEVPEGLAPGVQIPAALVSATSRVPTPFDPSRAHEAMMAEVDELNNLYVALTRPEERLCLVCEAPDGRKPAELAMLPALLHEYLQQHPDALSAPASAPQPRAGGTGPRMVTVDTLPYADWSNRVSFASPSASATLRLADDKVRFGLLAHDLLSMVLYADGVDEAVSRFALRHNVAPAELEALSALARRVVAHPATARFFARPHRVLTECWMMDGGEAFRPDRVVFAEGGEAWVVDFKTGGGALPEHHAQVRRYCRAVAATGWPGVKGFLLYTQPEIHVVEVECE